MHSWQFLLLVGYPPFSNDDQRKLFQDIRCAKYDFDEQDWHQISGDAKDLIRHLLVVDPAERWTIDQALSCSWFADGTSDEELSKRNLADSHRSLKAQNSRLRAIAKAIR